MNKYNTYKILMIIGLCLSTGLALAFWFLKNTNIQVFQELLQSTIDFFVYSLICILVFAFLLIAGEILSRIVSHDSIKNIFKSHNATRTMRKFAHTYGSKRNIDCPTETNETLQIKKCNHSLQTLVVTYYEDSANMKITLPADHEGQKMIKALFPDMKAELNELDDNFLFSDIVRRRNRTYQTTAKKMVDRG